MSFADKGSYACFLHVLNQLVLLAMHSCLSKVHLLIGSTRGGGSGVRRAHPMNLLLSLVHDRTAIVKVTWTNLPA